MGEYPVPPDTGGQFPEPGSGSSSRTGSDRAPYPDTGAWVAPRVHSTWTPPPVDTSAGPSYPPPSPADRYGGAASGAHHVSPWTSAPRTQPLTGSKLLVPRRRSNWALVAVVAAVIGALAGGGVGYAVANAAASRVATPAIIHQIVPANAQISKMNNVPGVLAKVEPAVVNITSTTSEGRAAGTGMVVAASGEVVTNYHVVAGAEAGTIKVGIPHLAGTHPAAVVGYDQSADVALLQVSGVAKLPTVHFGNSDRVQVGDSVVAVGNALALPGGPTVTEGIVSAVGRTLGGTANNGESIPPDLIQTDAAINPGNSGGPLVDGSAQVVGMNTLVIQQATPDESAQNLGFAIPSDTVAKLLPELSKGAKLSPGYLGVSVSTITAVMAKQYGISVHQGAIIDQVESGSPASKAGLRQYDVITALDGVAITSASGLVTAVSGHKAGQRVTLSVVRGSKTLHVAITLARRPLSG